MKRRRLLAFCLAITGCTQAAQESPPPEREDEAPAAAKEPAPPPADEQSTSIPAAFRGRWDATEAACSGRGSEMALTVEAGRLRFHESLAEVERVRSLGPDHVAVDLLAQGEGEVRRETRILRLDAQDRLDVELAGNRSSRVRCGQQAAAWDHQASGEGDGLTLAVNGERQITLFCPAEGKSLLVNVPAFRPIASEERMSLGSGALVTTLVADFRGDRQRGGVSGSAPVSAELDAILSTGQGLRVNYGAQNAGPFPPIPSGLAVPFLSGCRD